MNKENKMEGTITMYNTGRGYGFIGCGVREIFFNARYFARGFQPMVGRKVKFDVAPGRPGKDVMAINIEYIELTDEDQKLMELVRRASLAGNEGGGQ